MKPYDKEKCSSRIFQGYTGCMCDYCKWYGSQKGRWIVSKKGTPTNEHHEIALVRENNRHGLASYGWNGENKIIISSSTNYTIPKEVFDTLLKTAQKLANKYNKKEN